jgi:hypothetical protein
MDNFLLTMFLAFIIIVVALIFLALSWFFKGKSCIRAGSCGRDPTKKQDDESCGTQKTCGLCESKKTSENDRK